MPSHTIVKSEAVGGSQAAKLSTPVDAAAMSIISLESAIRQKVVTGELEWNQAMAEASSESWKDEWLTILVSIPLILAFTGHTDVVQDGFAALEAMPSFYQTAVGVVFAASFGVQQLTKMFKK